MTRATRRAFSTGPPLDHGNAVCFALYGAGAIIHVPIYGWPIFNAAGTVHEGNTANACIGVAVAAALWLPIDLLYMSAAIVTRHDDGLRRKR